MHLEHPMRNLFPFLIMAIALTACNGDPESPLEERSEPADQATVITESPVEPHSEDRSTEERREQLREAMRAHRQASQEADSPEDARASRREQRHTGPWWQDADLVESLGLEHSQIEAISQARETHRQDTAGVRREIAELRRRMSRHLAEGEDDQTTAVVAEREYLLNQLEQADRRWTQTIENILTPDQLEQLVTAHPDALDPRRLRARRGER